MIELTQEQKDGIAKGIRLRRDNVYDDHDLQAHLEQIIRDNNVTHSKHKEQLERMLYKTEEMMLTQAKYFGGDKTVLSTSKKQEKELWQKIQNLLKQGYSITRFKLPPPEQGKLI